MNSSKNTDNSIFGSPYPFRCDQFIFFTHSLTDPCIPCCNLFALDANVSERR